MLKKHPLETYKKILKTSAKGIIGAGTLARVGYLVALAIGVTVSIATVLVPVLWFVGGTVAVVAVHLTSEKLIKSKIEKRNSEE